MSVIFAVCAGHAEQQEDSQRGECILQVLRLAGHEPTQDDLIDRSIPGMGGQHCVEWRQEPGGYGLVQAACDQTGERGVHFDELGVELLAGADGLDEQESGQDAVAAKHVQDFPQCGFAPGKRIRLGGHRPLDVVQKLGAGLIEKCVEERLLAREMEIETALGRL